jgi:16S rRNA (guanine527-N7)-methyltransferase
MTSARIAELLAPFLGPKDIQRLTTNTLQQISTYIDLLLRWNAHINLTAVRDPEQIVTRHFGESLFAARHLFDFDHAPAAERPTVADLGSGAGFPGIPIKLWAPNISLTLIESNQKKATFLREVGRSLTLTDIDIQADRAEKLDSASFDIVTLRAVEHFESIIPVAGRLVAPAGRLALLIGSAQLAQTRAMLPQVTWQEANPIPLSNSRVLSIGRF